VRIFALLFALGAAGCELGERPPPGADAGEDGPIEPCSAYEVSPGLIDPALPWPGLRCTDFPALCGLKVDSTVREPDRAKAIDIVFVPEGFREAELADYQDLVKGFVADLGASDGFVARRPALFNFHRVDVASKTSRVGNADRTDTALAGCVDISNSGSLVIDDRLAGLAATANVQGTDVVVVVLNTNAGSPNASPGPFADRPTFVRVNPLVNGPVLVHEFGHALFHLGDEYSSQPACFTPPDLPTFSTSDYLLDYPNVSMEATGAKWALLHKGVEAGGLDFRHCVYSPGLPCLMKDGTGPFCTVCSGAVDATLDAREGKNDGPPGCAVEVVGQEPTYVRGSLEVRVVPFDRNAPTTWSLRLDGAEVGKGQVAGWWGRVSKTLEAKALPNGDHVLSVECQDALGAKSSAQVTLKVRN